MNSTKEQAIIHFNDGGRLYKINLYSEALEQYKKALDNNPTFYDAHFCLAKTLVRLKKHDQGIQHFSKYVHLIPKEKQGTYILALSHILIDEKQQEKALALTGSIDVSFTKKQVFDYVTLLLTNNRTEKAVHLIINLNDRNQINQGYKALLENDKIPTQIIERLKNDAFVPRFFLTTKKIKLLKTIGIPNKNYKSKVDESIALLEKIKNDKNINYNQALNEVESIILTLQDLLEKQGGEMLKAGDIYFTKKILSVLENTTYNSEKCNILVKKIKATEEVINKKILKIVAISIVSILIASIGFYFSYNWHQKSRAYKQALSSKDIYMYTHYINKYGDDDTLHKIREDKLFSTALESNNANDFNQLSRLYPNSNYLRSIKITVDNKTNGIYCFAIGDEYSEIDRLAPNFKIRVPIGSKIGYRINKTDKIPIHKYLTVSDNLEIKETTDNIKEIIFSEEFTSNSNGWPTFQESKSVYGKTKNKGVKINNGELQIFNEYKENDFVRSTIYLSVLTKNIDFEIEASINRNNTDRGTFLLFGATKRAFNYVGFNNSGDYLYGYNNWDDDNDSWVKLSDGWQYSNAINKGDYSTNILKAVKKNKDITFYLNEQYIGEMPIKRWYSNRIGFGTNSRTKAKINYIKVYQLHARTKINFKKDHVYYSWVDELNVRENGTGKGKIMTTIKIGDPVKYLGEIGSKKINATFRDVFSPDYYYKVELIDGTIGWVHGGALKSIPTSKLLKFDLLSIPSSTLKTSQIIDNSKFYMIAIYAEKEKNLIKKRVNEMNDKGFESNYLWIPDYKSLSGSKMYAAYVGPFSTKEQCKNKLNEVKKTYPKAYGLLASKTTTKRTIVN